MRMPKAVQVARTPRAFSSFDRGRALAELRESARNLERRRPGSSIAQQRRELADQLERHENPFQRLIL